MLRVNFKLLIRVAGGLLWIYDDKSPEVWTKVCWKGKCILEGAHCVIFGSAVKSGVMNFFFVGC